MSGYYAMVLMDDYVHAGPLMRSDSMLQKWSEENEKEVKLAHFWRENELLWGGGGKKNESLELNIKMPIVVRGNIHKYFKTLNFFQLPEHFLKTGNKKMKLNNFETPEKNENIQNF